jgi:hypothetical protein
MQRPLRGQAAGQEEEKDRQSRLSKALWIFRQAQGRETS